MSAEEIAVRLGAKKGTGGWMARCPAHDDRRASLSISEGREGRVLLNCHAGCSVEAIVSGLGLTLADLGNANGNGHNKSTIVAKYDYRDESGGLLYQVCRLSPKSFRQRRPDGAGGWIWTLGDVPRVLYRLREIQQQDTVCIVEGEKDVHRLEGLNLPATTNAGGAGKWRDEYTQQLVAAGVQSVVILPDNDEPGRQHGQTIAQSCHAAGLRVKVVTLPGLRSKGDVSNWLDAGHTAAELGSLIAETAQHPTPAGALRLTSLDALLSEPEDTVEHIVEDRIWRGSVNLLAGKPKAGKSTLVRHLAYCLSTGTDWLGHHCLAGPVWYLVLEDKRSEVRKHFRQLGATGREPIRFLFGSAPDLIEHLAHLAESERPIAIVVDTLQRLINAKDLNDYAEVTRRLDPVLAIARTTGAALVLVHHAGKGERAGIDTILGSTALAGSVDNILLLTRTDRYRVLSTIQRIGSDLPDTVLTLDGAGRLLADGSREAADQRHVEVLLLEALGAANGPLTQADWLGSVEARRQTKLRALAALRAAGQLVESGSGTKKDPRRYAVRIAVPGSLVPGNTGEPESFLPPLLDVDPTSMGSDSGSRVPTIPQVPEIPAGTRIAAEDASR